ncbi:bifunctional 4-hydroxy-2-oxoglutarate aldolase/2-dehydro-3-deoxy-phosphogluconate aldolase, partial [Jiangella rhizosphaerae]
MTDRIPPSAQLRETGVMAILRARSADRFGEISRTLVDAGITCLEITLTSPGALEAIKAIRADLPDSVDVGAGTVVDADQARAVVEAGAGFVVSPSMEADVVAVAREAGIPAYPGALTPTEVLAAWRAGATVVKLFPGSAVGPSYITALRGPFPEIAIMPTGGVSLDNIGDWIRAGAAGVGLGGPLLGDAADGGDLGALADRAARALA